MIDHATRYSQEISIFGSPQTQKFHSDNGGEFVNDEFTKLAEQFNTTVLQRVHGPMVFEKDNGILADLVKKTQIDTNCSLEMCLSWAEAVKNLNQRVQIQPKSISFRK